MEQRTQKREIGGRVYGVTCVDGRTALNLLQRMIGGVGQAMGGSLEAQVATALRSGFRVEEVADILGSQSTCDGVLLTEKVWPNHFRDKFVEMIEWIAFLLEVNYENFIEGFTALMKRYEPKKPENEPDGQD